MTGSLVLINPETTGIESFLKAKKNDRTGRRFAKQMKHTRKKQKQREIPKEYLKTNIHQHGLIDMERLGKTIYVGQYCDEGIIIPRDYGNIIFDGLYNCAPIISLIKGEQDFIAFLHTWAKETDSELFDKQAEHWMKTIAELGAVEETVFAPRKNGESIDTAYERTPEILQENSKTTIILERTITELQGITNKKGVYFQRCGYHLWKN